MVTFDRGDVIWVDFDPTQGREQRGRRPALVLSAAKTNRITGLHLVVPITSKVKNLLHETVFELDGQAACALASHLRSMDLATRRPKLLAKASENVVKEVTARALSMLQG